MSEEKEEKVFAEGFIFKKREGSPEWVVGSMSIKVDEAIEFLKKHELKGWVNLDVNKSKGGKLYVQLNDYKKDDGDLPF